MNPIAAIPGKPERIRALLLGSLLLVSAGPILSASFEGQIRAVGGRAGGAGDLLYTVSTNLMRVEMLDTNFPNAIDVVDLKSGETTLLMPMNRTFMRFKPSAPGATRMPPGFPGHADALPPGFGPQTQPGSPGGPPVPPPRLPAGIGPTNLPGDARYA